MWTLSAIALLMAGSLGLAFTFAGLHVVPVIAALAGLARWLYTRADSFVVRLHGARRLHFEEAPRLHELVAHLSIAAGIPCPRLYVVQRPRPNAFALGTSPRASSIVLTSAALDELDEAQLCAMAAHELAHIAHGHTRRATLVAALAAVMMRAAFVRRVGARGAASSRRVLLRLHRLGTPPERDFVADRAAAGLLGEARGLTALLSGLNREATWDELASMSDAGTPFTAPTVEGTPGTALNERISQLRRMAAEEQARHAKVIHRRSVHRGSRFYPRPRAPTRRPLLHPLPGRQIARRDDGLAGKRSKARRRTRGESIPGAEPERQHRASRHRAAPSRQAGSRLAQP
jgi:Zn-dependent protease with chaperone function